MKNKNAFELNSLRCIACMRVHVCVCFCMCTLHFHVRVYAFILGVGVCVQESQADWCTQLPAKANAAQDRGVHGKRGHANGNEYRL